MLELPEYSALAGKPVYLPSKPLYDSVARFVPVIRWNRPKARVVELVYTSDLKSDGTCALRVQVPPLALCDMEGWHRLPVLAIAA